MKMDVIVDEFTEHANPNPLIQCEGQSGCKAILRQSEAQPIHNQTFTVSKKVCQACLAYYRSKKTTVVRRHSVVQTSIEPSQIRRDVNASQRQGAHAPGNCVSAMPQMPRTVALSNPTTIQHTNYRPMSSNQGAVALAPISQQFGAFSNVPMPNRHSVPLSTPSSSGYSSAHSHYTSELQIWRGKASGRLGLNNVAVSVTAARQVEKGKGYEEIPLFREGFKVPEDISHSELLQQLIAQLGPSLKSYCQSHTFVFDTMIARETVSWVRVNQSFGSQRFFDEGRFLKKKGAKSTNTTKTFQPPSKPIEFLLIIDIEQVRKIDACFDAEFACEMEEEKIYKQQQAIVAAAHHQDLKRKTPPSPDVIAAQARSQPRPKPPKLLLKELPKETIQRDNSPGIIEHEPVLTPLQKINASRFSITGASLRDAIRLGGTINNYTAKLHDNITERVIYYPIPHHLQFLDLIDMVQKNKLSIKDEKNAIHGVLRYSLDPKSNLGSGAFKTSNLCVLTPMNKLPSGRGLGHSNIYDGHDGSKTIAMKRPFFHKKKMGNNIGKAGNVGRFALRDEGLQVMTEALLLLWATALHKLSYDFIDEFLAKSDPPPFVIPRTRFVYGALAFAQSDLARTGPSTVSNRAVFLLEELISDDELPFEKYIHNAEATPLGDAEDARYDTAVFLCFLQHVQYTKTAGLIYTSDYQGGATLLTDPQLMTSPSLGGDLFGDGNVSQVVEEFPQKHECNKYCKWFELGPVSEVLDDIEEGEIKEGTY